MLCHIPRELAQVVQHQGQLPQKLAFIVPKFYELVLPQNIHYIHQWVHMGWGRPKVGGPDIAGHLVCELEAGIESSKCCGLKTALVRFPRSSAQPSQPSLRAPYHSSCEIQW